MLKGCWPLKKIIGISLLVLIMCLFPLNTYAKSALLSEGEHLLSETIEQLEQHQTEEAKATFSSYKTWWEKNKTNIKKRYPDQYLEMEQALAMVSIDLVNENMADAKTELTDLIALIRDAETAKSKPDEPTLSSFIDQLKQVKTLAARHQWEKAADKIAALQSEWLAVEGSVVSQSQKVYTESEKNLVLLGAYVNSPTDHDRLQPTIDKLINDLTPLVTTGYGIWDAAFIPIREGLEALLVIGALLGFAKKAKADRARHWVWGGATLGMFTCLLIGILVSVILSNVSFGRENLLINGFSGIFASLMLLYVSYWLHRHADIKRWNQLIRTRSEAALSNGKMLSLSAIAFLAILREGLETVIFLIGMAGRMSLADLLLGIVIGFGFLLVVGFAMLKIGVKLPLKPFFLASSLIVFYLCLKFMGSGVHSLQMAGVIRSTTQDYLPSISWISIYPSWMSFLPQLVFILLAIVVVMSRWLKIKVRKEEHHA